MMINHNSKNRYRKWATYVKSRPYDLNLNLMVKEAVLEDTEDETEKEWLKKTIKDIKLTLKCDDIMKKALDLHKSKNYEEASRLYKKILSLKSTYPFAKEFLEEIENY